MPDTPDFEGNLIDYAKDRGRLPVVADSESAGKLRNFFGRKDPNRVVIEIDLKRQEQFRRERAISEAENMAGENQGMEIGRRYSWWVNTEEGRAKAEENSALLRMADKRARSIFSRVFSGKKRKDADIKDYLEFTENSGGMKTYRGVVARDRVVEGLKKMGKNEEQITTLERELGEWRWALKLKNETGDKPYVMEKLIINLFQKPGEVLTADKISAISGGITKGWEEVVVKSGDGKEQNTSGNF
jgi:hypothetical protein